MEKRFLVTIEYVDINRKNQIVIWAEDEEKAKRLALRGWGNPSMFKSITAVDTHYI